MLILLIAATAIAFQCGAMNLTRSKLPPALAFFDVGQGSCAVSRDENRAVIIDAGSSQLQHRPPNFKEQQIKNIITLAGDAKNVLLIVSHGHKDHYNWIPLIAEELQKNKNRTLKLLLGGIEKDYEGPSEVLKKLIELKKKLGDKGKYVSEFETKKSLSKYIAPFATLIYASIKPKVNINDRSIIVKLNEFSALITGDATGRLVDEILDDKKISDAFESLIATACHHASAKDGSNSEEFFDSVRAEWYIISAGLHTSYNHPHGSVTKRALECMNVHQISQVTPHTVSYYKDADLDDLIDTEGFRTCVVFKSGYATGVTTHAILSTLDVGTITFTETLSATVEQDHAVGDTFKECILKSLQSPILPFDSIVSLDLSDMKFTDTDCSTFPVLPKQLKRLNLSKNSINLPGWKKIFKLLRNHKVLIELEIQSQDNPYLLSQTDDAYQLLPYGAVVLDLEEESSDQTTDTSSEESIEDEDSYIGDSDEDSDISSDEDSYTNEVELMLTKSEFDEQSPSVRSKQLQITSQNSQKVERILFYPKKLSQKNN